MSLKRLTQNLKVSQHYKTKDFIMRTKTIQQLEDRLEGLEIIRDNYEPNESTFEDSYDDMLDECYPEVFGIAPSKILLECDPIQYRCGLSDYVDGLDTDIEDVMPEVIEEIEEIENKLEELEA